MRAPLRASLLLSALLWGVPARAEPPNATCEIRVVHALPGGKDIDARLARFRSHLERPPFTAWGTFKLLDEKDVVLALGKPAKMSLPTGKTATLTYVEHQQRADGPHRLEMRLQIEGDRRIDTSFVLDAGGVVLQAGQKYKDGVLALGFSCDVHHDHL
jgi:hypothetical protein